MPRDYHELPAEAYAASAEPLPADFRFNDSEPPPDPDFKESGGRFVMGYDPRRHTFTAEECSAGFWPGSPLTSSRGARRATSSSGRWPRAGNPSWPRRRETAAGKGGPYEERPHAEGGAERGAPPAPRPGARARARRRHEPVGGTARRGGGVRTRAGERRGTGGRR
jgi:hypothetical protein